MMTPSPPRLRPVSLDCCFDQGSGWQAIPAAQAFEGIGLRYSVSDGERVHIDPDSGQLWVATGTPHDGKTVRVRAQNDAGTAEADILIVVEDDGSSRATLRAAREIEIDDVTIRFNRPVEYGHFISGGNGAGDPFVIGPVTVESYSPGPVQTPQGRVMNGAMLNPSCRTEVGFDSLTAQDVYRPELNAGLQLPLRLEPGDALIICISNPAATSSRETAVKFVILTCVAEAPFEDSFRPPYSGPDRPIWRLSDIRTDRLLELPGVGRRLGAEERDQYRSRLSRFVLDIAPTWNRDHLSSSQHVPLYGRDLCNQEGEPFLWIHGTYPIEDKVDILISLVQNGIDRYGVFQSARRQNFHPWRPDGAHHGGRKFSILHAGHLLDDPGMLSIMDQSQALDGEFHEDGQTFYVTQDVVDLTNSAEWRPPYAGDDTRPKQPYEAAMIGIPDWRGKALLQESNAAWTGHPYRVSGNHNAQHAQVLLLLALGLREAWGHEAYFDYHMRFCEIIANRPDPWRFQDRQNAIYDPVEGSRPIEGWEDWQRRWRSELSWQMLMAYRNTYYSWPWAS